MERQTGVIIVAGGGGSRMGGARPKQFMLLGGMPILARTINNFAAALPGAEIVVVLPAEHTGFWHNLSARFEVAPHTVAEGGRERFHSVKNGLAALKRDPELIAVQDGVRPLGSQELIRRTVAAAAEHGTAIPVVELLRRAYETEYRPEFTDDASVVELSVEAVFLCEGERANLKITTPEDTVIAEALLADREETHETDGENI